MTWTAPETIAVITAAGGTLVSVINAFRHTDLKDRVNSQAHSIRENRNAITNVALKTPTTIQEAKDNG